MPLPDIDTQFFDSLMVVKNKLITNPFIQDSSNVVIGESPDLAAYSESDFPRIEILPLLDGGQGYASQRHLTHNYQFGLAGYIRRDQEEIKERDVKNIVAMGEKSRSLIYSILDDKQTGEVPAGLFDYIEGQVMLDFDFELFADICVFLLAFRKVAQTKDTEI